ncbi:hypothetical protein C8R44DRAFT_751439 [Mycena epipterygia]|nr:hypothetical protein C8R44DRAFT_751439 [Mycena epipterygia]
MSNDGELDNTYSASLVTHWRENGPSCVSNELRRPFKFYEVRSKVGPCTDIAVDGCTHMGGAIPSRFWALLRWGAVNSVQHFCMRRLSVIHHGPEHVVRMAQEAAVSSLAAHRSDAYCRLEAIPVCDVDSAQAATGSQYAHGRGLWRESWHPMQDMPYKGFCNSTSDEKRSRVVIDLLVRNAEDVVFAERLDD